MLLPLFRTYESHAQGIYFSLVVNKRLGNRKISLSAILKWKNDKNKTTNHKVFVCVRQRVNGWLIFIKKLLLSVITLVMTCGYGLLINHNLTTEWSLIINYWRTNLQTHKYQLFCYEKCIRKKKGEKARISNKLLLF